MRRADGRTIWLHDEVAYIPGTDGEPDLVQGVLYDVTERKLAEQALRESEQREREAAERLRALDEMKNTFLAAVSHELRSPLTSILGLALTLERAPDIESQDRGDLLVRLAANARKLDRLLKDLLDIDRLNRGIVEPQYRTTDVGALARRTVGSTWSSSQDASLVVASETVTLAVEPAQGGADHREPRPERGEAHGGGSGEYGSRSVRSTAGVSGSWWRTTGPAFPTSSGRRFSSRSGRGRPPRRTPPARASVSPSFARFTELHGGRVWIEDREGGGASFHVFLPGNAGEADPDATADGTGALTTTSSASS